MGLRWPIEQQFAMLAAAASWPVQRKPGAFENEWPVNSRLEPVQLRAHYDEAFERLKLLLSSRPDEPRLQRLRELVAFRERYIGWAASGPDRSIHAMEEMLAPPAWFVAISPQDPTARTQAGIFQTDWINPSMVATCIRPDPITFEWAVLGLVKGLEHLEAEVSGREPKIRPVWQHHAEDVRSYETEILAADLLTQDGFSEAIASALRENHLMDGKQVAALPRELRLWSVLGPLTTVITEAPAESQGEEAMRGGLCLIALGFQAVQNFAKDPESEFEQKVRFIQKLIPAPPRPG
jgi:hypothetical protein